MSTPSAEATNPFRLREHAEVHLKNGTAPRGRGAQTGLDALSLLHRLASKPETVDDALKLLHELQVHQVELDLQHEQMESTQRELAGDLARYQGLYEFAPVGYFSVGPEGDILEGNPAGAELFGVQPDELRGRRIDSFLAPECRPLVLDLLKRLRKGSAREACVAQAGTGNLARPLRVVASATPRGASFLMVFVDSSDRR